MRYGHYLTMRIASISTLEQLAAITAPGAPVAPVITGLDAVARDVGETVRPALVQARASQWLLGEVDRIRGAATTLRDSLSQLAEHEGMTTFDAAFAADDPEWDARFGEYADILGRAQLVLAAATVGNQAPITSTASV